MALTTQQIERAWCDLVLQDNTVAQGFGKPDLRAAVSALDTWLANNQASANAALPDPFKTNATSAQKFTLLAFVALRRAGL